MKFDEVSTLVTPENLPFVSGVQQLADGVLHVAVLAHSRCITTKR